MTINQVTQVDDRVPVKHALISVSDKSGLDTFIPRLLAALPDLKIFSTGGTFAKLTEILGSGRENTTDTSFRLYRPAGNPGGACQNPRF